MKKTNSFLLINVPPIFDISIGTGISYLKTYLDLQHIFNELINFNSDYIEMNELESLALTQPNQFFQYCEKYDDIINSDLSKLIDNNLEKIASFDVLAFSIFDYKAFYYFQKIYEILKSKNINKQILLGGCFMRYNVNAPAYSYLNDDNNITICDTEGETFFEEQMDLPHIPLYSYPQYYDKSLETSDRSIDILYGKGCINKCAFCTHRRLTDGLYFRDPKYIINEIIYFKNEHNITWFKLDCDNMANNIKKMNTFLRYLKIFTKKEKLFWKANFSLQMKYNEPLDFRLLKDAGCDRLMLGMESFNPKIRKDLNKPAYTNEDIYEFADNMAKNDIELYISLMIGTVTETEEDHKIALNLFTEFFNDYDHKTFINLKIYTVYWDEGFYDHEPNYDENGDWYYKDNTLAVRKRRINEYYREIEKHPNIDIFWDGSHLE